MKLLPVIIVILLLITGTAARAFETGAYIPYYRLETLPGAENTLGRPSYDTSSQAWDGRIVPDSIIRRLKGSWYEGSWSLRLSRAYNSFYLHIPLDKDFLDGISPDPRHISYLNSIIRERDTSIYLSLIGTSADFLPLVSDQMSLEFFTEHIAQIALTHRLDGIDLDWEFPAAPKPSEKDALLKLATELQKVLPEAVKLSAAVSRWRLPGRELFNQVDEIHLMAYDGYGRHATYESAVADSEIILKKFNQAPEKLVLGLPFYGRIYNQESDEYWNGSKNYSDIVRDYDPPPENDEAGEYFYNGQVTIAEKTYWAMIRGLRGVFVWEPFYDADGSESLTDAITQTLEGR